MHSETKLIPFHEIANAYPLLAEGPQFEELVQDVRRLGQQNDIGRYQGKILVGRRLYLACVQAGVEPRIKDVDPEDPIAYVVSSNLGRILDESQRAMVAARLATLKLGANQHSEGLPIGRAAQRLSVGESSVHRAKVVLERGIPEVIEAVDGGTLAVSKAADMTTKLCPTLQLALLKSGKVNKFTVKKALRAEAARIAALGPIVIPDGLFDVIVADIPWPVSGIVDYGVIEREKLHEIGNLISKKAASTCRFFLWVPMEFLPLACKLLEEWGWKYEFYMVWDKERLGQQPTGRPRYNCEIILVGSRGNPEFVDTTDFRTCFQGQRREHSRKPDNFYKTLKRVTEGRRLDMFARGKHDGFERHGKEIDRFDRPENVEPRREQPRLGTAGEVIGKVPIESNSADQLVTQEIGQQTSTAASSDGVEAASVAKAA